MKQAKQSLISRTESVLLVAAFATLALALIASLFLAQRQLVSTARHWDFLRVERYMRLCQMALEAQARAIPSEESLQKLRDIGLYLDVYPPDHEIPQPNPRFVQAIESVEMWDYVRGPDGKPVAVIRISRHDINTRHTLKTVRLYTAMAAVGGLLLIAISGLVLRKTIIKTLGNVSRQIREQLPGAVKTQATDPLEDLQLSVRALIDTGEASAAGRQRLLDSHSELMCLSSKEGTILAVNDAYCRLFERSREELVGTNYLDQIPGPDRAEALGSVQKLSRSNPASTAAHRVLLPDGSTRWLSWRDRAVFQPDGTIKEVLSYGTDISAEKALGEKIQALEFAFTQMQSLARTGSLTWDLARDIMEWTTETRRLLGVPETAKASLEAFLEIVAPGDREMMRHLFQSARDEGRKFEQEFRAVLPDGSLRVLQSRAEVLADPKTKILNNLTCTVRDITSLREAETATKRELRLREAVEQSVGVGIVLSDENGRNLMVNPAFCAMVGWSQDELLGITAPYPYWPEEEIPVINKAFDLAISGKTPPSGFELKFCRKDGTRFDVLVKVAPLLDSNDQQLGWLGAVTDISSLQKTRRELQATNERLQIAQDVAEFGIWDWDPNTDTLFWDKNSFAIFGRPDATDPKEVWGSAHSEEEQERLTYELQRLIDAGGTSGQDKLVVRWPDGSQHNILSTYVIVRDDSGCATRVLGVNRDVTAELEEERELRSTKERLVAALEGGNFGTFEHIFGVGAANWNTPNYEMHGIDSSITDPDELYRAWRLAVGDSYPAMERAVATLPVDKTFVSYDYEATPPGTAEKRRIRSSVFVERNEQGHPVRLVGVARRLA